MFGANYFGSLVFGAGLVVTSQTPVQPSSGSVAPYATHAYATGVFGAGQVVTSQTPVPPSATGSYQPYATHVFGSGVFGAGMVVTSQVPVPPTQGGIGGDPIVGKFKNAKDRPADAKRITRNVHMIEQAIMAFYYYK